MKSTCDYCNQPRLILLKHPTIVGWYCVNCKDKHQLPATTPNRIIINHD